MDRNSSDYESLPEEILPETLDDWHEENQTFTLIDIRKPFEREQVKLDDDLWIPMSEIPEEFDQLREMAPPIILYCHHGQRSFQATKFVREQGIEETYSLAGGIDAWARSIDSDLPRY